MTSVKTTNSFDKGCMSFAKNIKADTSNISVQKSRTKRKLKGTSGCQMNIAKI